MREHAKTFLIIVLLIGIVSMTIAYAALTRTFKINSTGKVLSKENWDIHFTNPSDDSSNPILGGSGLVERPLELTSKTTLENLVAVLKAPGDSVSYTFYVVNDGILDAKISSIAKTSVENATYTYTSEADRDLVKQYIYYDVVYTGTNTAPEVNDTLAAGASRKMKLTIGYSSSAPSLPSNTVTVSGLNYSIDYVMND